MNQNPVLPSFFVRNIQYFFVRSVFSMFFFLNLQEVSQCCYASIHLQQYSFEFHCNQSPLFVCLTEQYLSSNKISKNNFLLSFVSQSNETFLYSEMNFPAFPEPRFFNVDMKTQKSLKSCVYGYTISIKLSCRKRKKSPAV